MARGRSKIKRRKVEADSMYNSLLLTKFINRLMQDGKKTTAQRVVYGALDILKEKGQEPLQIFDKALDRLHLHFHQL